MKPLEVLQFHILEATSVIPSRDETMVFALCINMSEPITKYKIKKILNWGYSRLHTAFRALEVARLLEEIKRNNWLITNKGFDVIDAAWKELYPEDLIVPTVEAEVVHVTEEKVPKKRKKKEDKLIASIKIDTKGIPIDIVEMAATIIQKMNEGECYGKLGGKALRHNHDIISIPLGRKWRLLCKRIEGRSVEPRKILSHEDYNQPHKRQNI
jgi:hypothetical protein